MPTDNADNTVHPPQGPTVLFCCQQQFLPVHLYLSLPLEQRHSSQLDVYIIDALVEEIASPLGNLTVNTKQFAHELRSQWRTVQSAETHGCVPLA